jgi:hypothetical protein
METEELETPEEVVEEVEETEEDVDNEEEPEKPPVNQAQALFDLLNNQATAKSTLQMIAYNLGLTVSEAKTQEGQKAIADVIKEALGEDMAFLGDKLGPLGNAIEKLISTRISEVESKINEQFKNREAAVFEAQSNEAIVNLDKQTKGEFSNLLPKINKLMEEIPLGKTTSPEIYLRRLYNIAKSESSTKSEPNTERAVKARRESNNNAVQGSGNPMRTKSGSSRLPSIREAVQAAARGEKLE